MEFLSLTLTTGETFMMRADLVLQVRPHEGGSRVWFPTGTVEVRETVDDIRGMLRHEQDQKETVA
jgi:hypothetical protein